jgi:hypothetical protein
MSLSDLSKEQKQYVVVGAVAAVLLVFIIVGIRSGLSSVASAKAELQELREKIGKAERSLSRKQAEADELGASSVTLKDIVAGMPPEKNYYSWATEIIYAVARSAALDVDAIDESNVRPSSDKAGGIRLETYSLRITAHGGYGSIKRFVHEMDEQHPLVRFSGLEVSAGSDPEEHEVQFHIQWPASLGDLNQDWDALIQKQQAKKRVQSSAGAPKQAKTLPSSAPRVEKKVDRSVSPVKSSVSSKPKASLPSKTVRAPKPVVPSPVVKPKPVAPPPAVKPKPVVRPQSVPVPKPARTSRTPVDIRSDRGGAASISKEKSPERLESLLGTLSSKNEKPMPVPSKKPVVKPGSSGLEGLLQSISSESDLESGSASERKQADPVRKDSELDKMLGILSSDSARPELAAPQKQEVKGAGEGGLEGLLKSISSESEESSVPQDRPEPDAKDAELKNGS